MGNGRSRLVNISRNVRQKRMSKRGGIGLGRLDVFHRITGFVRDCFIKTCLTNWLKLSLPKVVNTSQYIKLTKVLTMPLRGLDQYQ